VIKIGRRDPQRVRETTVVPPREGFMNLLRGHLSDESVKVTRIRTTKTMLGGARSLTTSR
jgi:hypothetical protein